MLTRIARSAIHPRGRFGAPAAQIWPFAARACATAEDSAVGENVDSANVIRVLHRVQEICGHSFNFSRIVMCGDQSAGKTSVLEALIGEDISVKDQQMATRRPLLLSLIKTQPGSQMFAKFRDGEQMYNFSDVKARIAIENEVTHGDVSSDPIQLTIYSPEVFDTILVDLPGFIAIPQAHQDEHLPDEIKKLNLPYLQDPGAILCVVNSAVADPATSLALREALKADRSQDRSIGIVTKVDLVGENKDALKRLLTNEMYPLGLGRIGIRCRTQAEQLANKSWNEAIEIEKSWIEKSGLDEEPDVRLGIPLLRKTLSDILIQRISGELPYVIRSLDKRIAESEHNQGFLMKLANESDLRTVSRELENLVNQLHPASDTRCDLEEDLRDRLFDTTQNMISDASRSTFDYQYTTETKELDHGAPGFAYSGLKSTEFDSTGVENYNIGKFRDMLVLGARDLGPKESEILSKIKNRGIQIGLTAGYFQHVSPDNPRRARRAWFKGLESTVDHLLVDSEEHPSLVTRSYDIFLKTMMEFAESADTRNNSESSSLAKLYFRFLLQRISERIRASGLNQELVGMVAREKRPVADFLEHQNELAKLLQHPGEFHWIFGDTQKKLEICVFNNDWTDGYMRLMAKRLSDDLYRNYAVRLLEPMVYECIQFSLNMFKNGGSLQREANLEGKQLMELRECRDVLQKTLDLYSE